MIISHKHRFIFLHVRKAAGSSVTVFLSRHLGPWDIRVGALSDCIEAGIWLNPRTALEFLHPAMWRRIPPVLLKRRLERVDHAHKKQYNFLGPDPTHPNAETVKQHYPREWENYFKFSIVRNPFERLVSLYLFLCRGRSMPPFRDFLKAIPRDKKVHCQIGWPCYAVGGEIAVDFVGRYEYLHDDMKAICERIGVPFDPDRFPVAKKGPSYDYRDYYGPEERKIVERLCAKEIEAFSYRF